MLGIPAVGSIVAAGLAVGFVLLLQTLPDPPPLVRFYGPPFGAAISALITSPMLSRFLRARNLSTSGAEIGKRVTGWGVGFFIGWAIGMAFGGVAAAVVTAAAAGLLSFGYVDRVQDFLLPDRTQANSSQALAQTDEEVRQRPRLILMSSAAVVLATLASAYAFRSYLPSRLIASSAVTSPGPAIASIAGSGVIILAFAAMVGRRSASTPEGIGRGALVGGASGFAIYAFSGFLFLSLLSAEPVLARLGAPFTSTGEMEATLVDVALRGLWMQPVGGAIFLLAGSTLGGLGGLLAGASRALKVGRRLNLDPWRYLAAGVYSASAVLMVVFVVTSLLPPVLRTSAQRSGFGLPLAASDALSWLPSAWPFIVVLLVMAAGAAISRNALPDQPEEMRSVAWIAWTVASVPWLAIYPAWQLASRSIVALLLAAAGTLMSFYLILFSRSVADRTGGWIGGLTLGGISASLKTSYVGALVGVCAATPMIAFGVSTSTLVVPLWGSLSPEAAAPLRAPLGSYFSATYRLQAWWLSGTTMVLFLSAFVVTWGLRPFVKIYQWAVARRSDAASDEPGVGSTEGQE